MIVYEVMLEQKVFLPGRAIPDTIERIFKLAANSKQAATQAVIRAGYKGNIVRVKPIIASPFEY